MQLGYEKMGPFWVTESQWVKFYAEQQKQKQ
jgi:hypothetical protein